MHILIINFNLNNLSRSEYEAVCNEVAPAFAEIPGLISKKWLANEETNTYGGVYLWKDRQAMLDYQASDIYKGIAANPAFANMTAADFEMLAAPSQVTGVEGG
ncbi:MAG: YdhR family protein [Phycisphaerales bacterium]|nr:YdhR family protein [Phycisphaerales bacterium]